jgi:hypothetical protein
MQPVLLHSLHVHRLKRPQADVQCDLRRLNTARAYSLQDLRREMQPRGRRSHRASITRIDSLISLAVCRFVRSRNIRRQRHVTNFFQDAKEVLDWFETQRPLAVFAARDYFRTQLVVFPEEELFTDADFSPGADECVPN